MSATISSTVEMTSAAESLLIRLGLHRELEQTIEQARQHIKGLRSLRVDAPTPYEGAENEYLRVEAGIAAHQYSSEAQRAWYSWQREVFSNLVCDHLHVYCYPEAEHAR